MTALTDGTPEGTIDEQAAPAAAPADSSGGSSSLIVTSSASRASYADNVNGLKTALGNTGTAPTAQQAVRYDGNNVYNQPDGKGGFYSGPISGAPGTLYNVPDGNGGFYSGPATGAPIAKTPTTTPAKTDVTLPSDGSTTPAVDPNANGGNNGGANGADANGGDTASADEANAVSTLPPSIGAMFKQTFAAQDKSIADAKTTIANAAATVANDPAAQQAAAAIAAKYDILINAMKEKNRQVLGGFTANAARTGGLQYANDMTETFMSAEMDRASARIADLVSKEQELILKSNAAYKANDIKAFNSAQTALDKATKEKTDTLGKLLTATNNQVKAVQAQQKIDAAAAKQQLTTDTTTAAKIAAGMAKTLKDSGVTDPEQISQFVAEMAKKNGITNPDILSGALETERQKLAKTNYAINKPYPSKGGSGTKPKVDGGYTYTPEDIATYSGLLNKGGTAPSGDVYAGRGSDGFVDPGAYVAAYNDWIKNNGTVAGFTKNFPVATNVNPDSIANLPKALQPKTKAAAGPPTSVPPTSAGGG